MKLITSLLALVALATASLAADPVTVSSTPNLPATFVKGDLNIRYDSRSTEGEDAKPKEGVLDTYELNFNVSNSARFRGTITNQPYVKNVLSDQLANLTYNMDLDVLNPANPTQSRNIGKMTGTVPINKSNIYDYNAGNVQVSVFAMGNAKGFESKSKGTTAGKPPAESGGMFSRLAKSVKERINVTKSVAGKTVTIAVTKYDKMDFTNHVLAAGPVQIYSDVTINGTILYDYQRSAWYLQDITVTYYVDGRIMSDKLSGNIRWTDGVNGGDGKYEFDVRVNEPAPSEASLFAAPTDESAFFATDTSVPSLTGEMTYKDSKTNDVVTRSAVKINLVGNKLTKHQTMYLAKLFLLTLIVPFNAE